MRPDFKTFRGWIPLLIAPAAVVWLWPNEWPQWGLMWAVASSIFAGCKWLTFRRTQIVNASMCRKVAYLWAWPGMDAATFLTSSNSDSIERPRIAEWLSATLKLAIGVVLLRDVCGAFSDSSPFVIAWSGMIGLMLVLHFGLFQLLSCFWRMNGIDARPLMNRPIASTSLSELWSRRWNIAFRDLMHRFLFQSLAARVGPRWATWLGFAISGVIHDIVMSLPAGGGYGQPTLFFVIQAMGLMIERSQVGRRIGLGHGPRGWLFAMLVLIGPSSLLLHQPFLERVIVPFVIAVRSL